MIGPFLLAAALQSASWRTLPLTTPIPPMLFVCTPKGESRPTFRTPWWQIAIARTSAVDRVKLFQVGDRPSKVQVSLKDSLRSYEVLEEAGKSVWRLTYERGPERLILQYLSSPEGRDNLKFEWRRPRGVVMEGACEQGPQPTPGWELKEEGWR